MDAIGRGLGTHRRAALAAPKPQGRLQTRTPLEPLYPLAVACELIPFTSISALTQFLYAHKNEFPARYRTIGGSAVPIGGYRIRLLTESECVRIREMTILTGVKHGRSAHGSRERGPIGAIIERALTGT